MLINNIMVVYECRVSGGTDRLLIHLIKSWPDKNLRWVLYLHHENSGINLFRKELSTTNAEINIYFIGKNEIGVTNNPYVLFVKKAIRKVFRFPRQWINFARLIIYFRKYLIDESPDVLYLHNGGYPGSLDEHAACIATQGINSLKVIMGIQNIPVLTGSGLKSLFFNYIDNRFIDAYILGSERSKEVYEEHTNLDRMKLFAINEGVDSNTNNIHKKKNSKYIKIGIIGAYEKRKGHNILFKAVNILNQYSSLNKFKIICYGQSKYGHYKTIKKLTKDMSIDHLVEFNEFEEDMDKLYLPLDIVVSPSTVFETMPLVLIDALAYYKPVIGSKLQGIMDIIDHGSNGYLFDIGDYRTLAKYLTILIMNDQKRNSFGLNGRKRYENNFTAQRMAKDYFKVFMS